MADSQLILELMFLHIQGGCSLMVLLFLLMLMGTCCFILSASLCVGRTMFYTLMSVRQKKLEVCQSNVAALLCCCKLTILLHLYFAL